MKIHPAILELYEYGLMVKAFLISSVQGYDQAWKQLHGVCMPYNLLNLNREIMDSVDTYLII